MVNLFTYGSLMCDDIMVAVVSCQLATSNAILDGFYRSKVRDEERALRRFCLFRVRGVG